MLSSSLSVLRPAGAHFFAKKQWGAKPQPNTRRLFQKPCHCEPVINVTGVAIRPPHAPHPQPMRRGGVLPRPSITFAPPSMSLRTGDRCHRCGNPPPCTAPSSAWGKRLSALCQKNCHRPRRPWQFAYIVISSATLPAQTAAASGRSPAAPAASPRTKTA